MTDISIETVGTCATTGSVAKVGGEDVVCTLATVENAFGDHLPVIPMTSNVESKNILYHMKLVATLTNLDGEVVPASPLIIVSNRVVDKIVATGRTDANGKMLITLESRMPGALALSTKTARIALMPYKIILKEAWYEAKFKITGYNVCLEDDFHGELTAGNGLDEKYRRDFLFSVDGIAMQGKGQASNGRLIGLKRLDASWHRNAKGNRDYIEDENGVTFQYLTEYGGKWKAVQAEHSIAVDPKKIAPLSRVHIEGVGERFADDTGSMSVGYHIDNFLGAGRAVVSAWLKGGVNGTERRVKFLGYTK
jgi:3D (Asp-Asp-Asp) domain-containing protein